MQRSLSQPKLPLLAILAAGALALALLYGPRLSAPWMWDDRPTIQHNPALERPFPWRALAGPEYFTLSTESTWRPMATLSYSAMVRAFGKNPVLLRAMMLLAHLLNACLLYSVLRRAAQAPAVAAAACGLFLLHPAHIETLLCVSFNEEILAAAGLLAMLAAHQRGWTLAAALAFGAALLSKETALAGLALLPLYDAALRGKAAARRHGKAYLLLAAVAAAYIWVRFGLLKGPGEASGPGAGLGFAERLYYGLAGWATMARVFALPVRLRIEYFALPPSSWAEATFNAAAGLAAGAGLAWALMRAWKRSRALAFFLIWPVLFWLPVSQLAGAGVLSLRLAAERWLYLPCLGAAAAAARLLPRKGAGLVMIFWLACGAVRARDWSADSALWESLASVYPWSAKAQQGLGEAYWHVGSYSHAQAAFEKALRLRETRQDRILSHYAPRGVMSWDSPSLCRWLALSYLKSGQTGKAKDFFARAQGLQPSDVFAYRALGYLYAREKDWAKAGEWAAKGLAASPQDEFLSRLKKDVHAKRLSFHADFN